MRFRECSPRALILFANVYNNRCNSAIVVIILHAALCVRVKTNVK